MIQRLQDFLDEEEIEEARPTHRRAGSTVSRMPPTEIHPRLGFEDDASFEYYVSSKKPKKAKPLVQKKRWWFSRAATTEETEPLLNSDDTVVTAPVSQAFILTGLNLKFPEKQLTSIIGATGAGKTSLLMAILGGT